jgi:hypothetical protein
VNHFCTVSTQSHLYKVSALADSLNEHGEGSKLHVLIVDSNTSPSPNHRNCQYWKLSDLNFNPTAQIIVEKYKGDKDKLRWSLKPIFLKHLITKGEIDKLVYLDTDLFFYSNYQFLFGLLDEHSFLLTPHYYKYNPNKEQNWFEANFRVGLYNAGFVGVNKKAINTLQWWAECCVYRCEKNSFRGLFDDQKYLDLIPVIDKAAHVLRHKGCNVAGWNTEICKRERTDGAIKIDGEFPIVFIHFNATTIREIMMGDDKILLDYYKTYSQSLKKYKNDLQDRDLLFAEPIGDKIKRKIWRIFTDLGV